MGMIGSDMTLFGAGGGRTMRFTFRTATARGWFCPWPDGETRFLTENAAGVADC